jgi:hypothetical protein
MATDMIAIEDLPPAFQNFDLAAAQGDAHNLVQMIGLLELTIQQFDQKTAGDLEVLNMLGSVFWVFRDLAEALAWKLERLEKAKLEKTVEKGTGTK